MAALRLTYQGRPAIHALEAGGLLSLLAPGVPAHKALHVLDLNIQALGARSRSPCQYPHRPGQIQKTHFHCQSFYEIL